MSDDAAAEMTDRLAALEAHIAHQEQAIEDMNSVILDQAESLTRLTRRLDVMLSRLGELEAAAPGPDVKPPPHY
jgi:SlyX protein